MAIQLPGHETRIREPIVTDIRTLVPLLVAQLQVHLTHPYAFLGHSMGALLSFETARLIRRMGLPEPAHLFFSGLRAVQLPNPDPPLHALTGSDLLRELQLRYGLQQRLLAEPELIELVLPLLRADFKLCETYKYQHDSPFDCPISVFGAAEDHRIRKQDLEAWQVQTTKPLRLRILEGGHNVLENSWTDLVRYVSEDLLELAPGYFD